MMSTARSKKRMVTCFAAATVIGAATACSPSLESFSTLSPSLGASTFSLTAAFSNALNLPAKAKVKFNGADIGEVTQIRSENFIAYVTMRIRKDIPLFEGSTAELRSATPLGDLFVAIHTDPHERPGTKPLENGATLPVNATSAAASVEEVLSSAALLLNGGAIRHFVSVINGVGARAGGSGEKIAALLHQSNSLLSRLADRSSQIDEALRGTADLATTLTARQDILNTALDAAAPATATIQSNTARIADLTDTAAHLTTQLSRFPSLQGNDTRSILADLNRLSVSLNDINADPQLSMTALNRLIGIMMKSTNGTAAHANVEVPKLALGSLPDKNYPGDPAFHGPDGTDWHAMIGSLRYQWNVLLGNVLGPQR